MSMRIVTNQGNRFSVELAYPAPMFEELDELLDRLVGNYRGAWPTETLNSRSTMKAKLENSPEWRLASSEFV